jgi:hypothetical protein
MRRWQRLYPADWRLRYGEEIDAVLNGRRLSPRDALDLIRGSLDAWRHPLGAGRDARRRERRRTTLSTARWAGFMLLLTGALATAMAVADRVGVVQFWSRAWVWNLLPLVPIFTLFLVGMAGVYLLAPPGGWASVIGKIALLATLAAFLGWTASVVLAPALPAWASSDSVNGLELSITCIGLALQTGMIGARRLIPRWSVVALLVLPAVLIFLTAAVRRPGWLAGPNEPFDQFLLLCGVVWLLVGGALWRAAPTPEERVAAA